MRFRSPRPPAPRAKLGASREMSLDEFVAGAPKKRAQKKGPKACAAQHEAARKEAERYAEARAWSTAAGRQFVGLYSLLHERVYGVRPDELDSPAFFAAVAAAERAIRTLGIPDKVFEFVRWTWRREEAREQKRRDQSDGNAFRIGWRLQFSPSMVTDFRVAQERARPKK